MTQSRAELSSVLASTQTIIARVDRDCRHLYINDAIENEIGIPATFLFGKTFAKAGLNDKYTVLIGGKVEEAFATKKEQQAEIKNQLLGDTRYLYAHFTPEFDANGEVETVLIVCTNVTDLKLAEKELRNATAEIKDLQSILPICSYCKQIRDDESYWHTVENYISSHTSTQFSHGICPSCYTNVVKPELESFTKGRGEKA
ncbi:MAG: PAS domain-containing protein [Pyrinomonadaceae bacterium]